jgi:hypothetical protein
MPQYQAYPLNHDYRVIGPAIAFEAANDQAAISRAQNSIPSPAKELWQDTRLVGIVGPAT